MIFETEESLLEWLDRLALSGIEIPYMVGISSSLFKKFFNKETKWGRLETVHGIIILRRVKGHKWPRNL